MILLIADDFTGALDTGIQFAKCGLKTKVVTTLAYDFTRTDDVVSVLVIDAETRHLPPTQAYQRVFDIVNATQGTGISIIFKKTDSALRGNLGSELSAVLDASTPNVLHFLPAFPAMNRITKDGIHYIDGIPVSESIFGNDNYNPIKHSYIPDLIATQSNLCVETITNNQSFAPTSKKTIAIYDANTDLQLRILTKELLDNEEPLLLAGCAGIANPLAKELKPHLERVPISIDTKRLIIFCGSTNKITQQQLDYAEQHHFQRIRLTPEECLDGTSRLSEILEKCTAETRCIIDTNDLSSGPTIADYAKVQQLANEEVRTRIVRNLSTIIESVLSEDLDCLPLITGGDTLFSFMSLIGISEITPLSEVAPGVVLSSFKYKERNIYVLSKSGGFGNEALLVDLANEFVKK